MSPGRLSYLVAVAGALATFVACVDLFHSTDSSLCDGPGNPPCDAAVRPEAAVEAGAEGGPVEICAASSAEASARADRVCALLGACTGALGTSSFGQCRARAMLAFDCTGAPDRKVKGVVRTYWTCLASARTCDDVDLCVWRAPVRPCGDGATPFIQCGNPGMRAECTVAAASRPSSLESCSGIGQSCVQLDSEHAFCAGKRGLSCAPSTPPTCDGTHLVHCSTEGRTDAGIDVGYDCADFGAGSCAITGSGPACVPDGPQCQGEQVRCQGTRAEVCVGGRRETLDCATLGVPCNEAGPVSDATQACFNGATPCDSDDYCEGSKVVSCLFGATFKLDCVAKGYKGCTRVPGNPPRVFCTK